MSDGLAVFTGDPSKLTGIDIDGPIEMAKRPCCDYFGQAFRFCGSVFKFNDFIQAIQPNLLPLLAGQAKSRHST